MTLYGIKHTAPNLEPVEFTPTARFAKREDAENYANELERLMPLTDGEKLEVVEYEEEVN